MDLSLVLKQLSEEGFHITKEALATTSPYLIRNLKRFGDFVVDMDTIPDPFQQAFQLPFEIDEI